MIRAAVLGSPISHSLSPILHMCAYEVLGISGSYEAIDIQPEQLRAFINSLDRSWTGFSLTMPLKEEILKIADVVDPMALSINSANTLIRSQGRWRALSTDVSGFTSSLEAHGITQFSRVAILGAGATARAAARAVEGRADEIYVLQRSSPRSALRQKGMRDAAPTSEISFLEWTAKLPDLDLLINTTPRGAADDFLGRPDLHISGVFFEALYDPWPSLLLARWRERGYPTIDGLDLLVHQGIAQVKWMTGIQMERAEIAPILRARCLSVILGRSAL